MPKSKILKYNYVNVAEERIDIEPPVFDLPTLEQDFTDDEFIPVNLASAPEDEPEPLMTPEELMAAAKERADELIAEAEETARENAEREAEEIRAAAMSEASLIRDRARNDGYNKGYEQGTAAAEAMKNEAASLLEDARNERERILAEIEPQVVDLTVDILDKILGDVKVIEPQVVLYLVKKGLSETKMSGEITVKVSDSEYDAVVDNKQLVPELAAASAKIEIVRDHSLASGDCVIETEFGNVDCSIDEQFKKVRESLYFMLSGGRQGS